MNETTREMVFENETEKEEFLKKEYPFDVPKMDDRRLCIHCNQIIRVGDFKVEIQSDGENYIMCPNWPECDGTVLDWFPAEMKAGI